MSRVIMSRMAEVAMRGWRTRASFRELRVNVSGSCWGMLESPRYKLPPSLLLFQQRQQIVCCGALAQAWEDFVNAVLVRKGVQISHCIRSEYDVISMFVSMPRSCLNADASGDATDEDLADI